MSKKHGAEFQAKGDLSGLANAQTYGQLVIRFEIHPTLIPSWNRMLLESAIQLIDKSHS